MGTPDRVQAREQGRRRQRLAIDRDRIARGKIDLEILRLVGRGFAAPP